MSQFLIERLQTARARGLYRNLSATPTHAVDFCSNDYLGLARAGVPIVHETLSGATGSRLLSGECTEMENTEKYIAQFHHAESALVFNSGYNANLGLFASIAERGDTIIYDAQMHASVRDGIRLSLARAYRFAHNDVADLEKKIAQVQKGSRIFIAVESVYSMDGDVCPLLEILKLSEAVGAHIILDEAHALGVIGVRGAGLAQSLGVENKIFARMYAYGKSLGLCAAAVVGSAALREYLINFARAFIFTTALPLLIFRTLQKNYERMATMDPERAHLQKLIARFSHFSTPYATTKNPTPVQAVWVVGSERAQALAQKLRAQGIWIFAIRSPTVAAGRERLRVILHAFNSTNELDTLEEALYKMS